MRLLLAVSPLLRSDERSEAGEGSVGGRRLKPTQTPVFAWALPAPRRAALRASFPSLHRTAARLPGSIGDLIGSPASKCSWPVTCAITVSPATAPCRSRAAPISSAKSNSPSSSPARHASHRWPHLPPRRETRPSPGHRRRRASGGDRRRALAIADRDHAARGIDHARDAC